MLITGGGIANTFIAACGYNVVKHEITDQISYISTGGGAFPEFMEGKQLTAVAMLEARKTKT